MERSREYSQREFFRCLLNYDDNFSESPPPAEAAITFCFKGPVQCHRGTRPGQPVLVRVLASAMQVIPRRAANSQSCVERGSPSGRAGVRAGGELDCDG